MGRTIEFARPDGASAPGYLADPRSGNGAPGVVLFEEWWGVDQQIKDTADRLSESDFRVLVPDVFRGKVAATGDEANHMMEGLDFADAATQDARGAAAALRSLGSDRVAVMGFCMGGALAMLSAMHLTDFDAAVVFYGFPPPEGGDPATIKIPIQGHWAAEDSHFNLEGVDAIERKLDAAGVAHEFYRYDAKHGFYNTGELGKGGLGHYHPEHAETAWRRTVEFLQRTLS